MNHPNSGGPWQQPPTGPVQHQPFGSPYGQPGASGPWPQPGQPPFYDPRLYQRPIRQNSNILCTGLILMFVLSFLISMLMMALTSILLNPFVQTQYGQIIDQVQSIISYTISFAVPCALMGAWIRIPTHVAFPIKKMHPPTMIAAVFLCMGVNILGSYVTSIISVFTQSLFGVVPTSPDFTPPTQLPAIILYFISVTILPAILEEFMFRGIVMQSLRRYGDGFALITSSILFALMHGNLVQIPSTFFVGLVMGYFVLRTGTILSGMIIHFMNNFIVVVISLTTYNMAEDSYLLVNLILVACYIIFGCIALIYLLRRHNNMFRTAPSRYPLRTGKKYSAFFIAPMSIVYLLLVILLTALYFA